MPKGRIGLSLDEDVLAILNEYGRGKERACFSCQGKGTKVGGDEHRTGLIPCPMCSGTGIHNDSRPTRTEIVAQGVRMWLAARQGERSNGSTPASPDVQTDRVCQECGELEGRHQPDCERVHGISRLLSCSDCLAREESSAPPSVKEKRKANELQWSCCGRPESEHKTGINSTVCPTPSEIKETKRANRMAAAAKRKAAKAESVGDAVKAKSQDDEIDAALEEEREDDARAACPHLAKSRVGKKCTACGVSL